MFIMIHLFVMYLLECFHFINDTVHFCLNKKSENMIRCELQIKHREEREQCRKLKQRYIETLNKSHYLRIPISNTDDIHKIIIWKFTEQKENRTSKSISAYLCDTCGNYCYGENSIYKNKKGYSYKVICECRIDNQ